MKTKPETKAEAAAYRNDTKAKEHQIGHTVKWCKENNKQKQAALKTEMFPLIKDHGTIDRLDGKVTNGKKEYLRILLPDEEKDIVTLHQEQKQSI